MNLINKSFKDNKTGDVFRIIDSYQNIAITDKKEKIDATRLLDTRFYSEYIDPKSFFSDSSTYNVFAEKIRSVDLSKIPDDAPNSPLTNGDVINMPSTNGFNPASNESAVVMYDPEEEKAELARKYGASMDNGAAQAKQRDAFAKLLGEEGEVVQVNADRPEVKPVQTKPQVIEEVQRIEVQDPIITMFKSAKKNVDFSVDLKVEGKLPRLDFIEMMEDSYEVSIIEFLAEEFTKDLLQNPSKLKMKVIEEIKKKVYPKSKATVKETQETTEVVEPKTTRRKKTNPKE